MTHLLHISVSTRGDRSISRQVGRGPADLAAALARAEDWVAARS